MCVAQLLINTLWKTTTRTAMRKLWGVMVMCQRNICITLSACTKTWTLHRFLLLDDIKCRDQPSHPWKRKQSVQHSIQMDTKCARETQERSEATTVDSGAMRCQNWIYIFFCEFAQLFVCDKTKICVYSPPQSNTAAWSCWKIAVYCSSYQTHDNTAVASSGMRLNVDEDERCIYI